MKLHVFPPSPNSKKVMFTNHFLELQVEEELVDLPSGQQKSETFLGLNPNGKVPVLEYADGTALWESNAICNRLCAELETELWPKSNQRYNIMRWQFWESCHWTPVCGKFISKYLFKVDGVDLEKADEEFNFFAKVLDGHLQHNQWLSDDQITTGDISVACVLVYKDICQYPIQGYGNILRWFDQIQAMPSWGHANPSL